MERRFLMKKLSIFTCFLVIVVLLTYSITPSKKLFELGVSAERTLAGLSSNKVEIDEGNIAYIEGGKGEVLILLHGFGANKDNWVRLAKHLTKDYYIIAPDLPGFGNSFKNINLNYDVDYQVARLNAFISKLEITKFHIAGNSMGGYIAGNYAATYPEKVMSLWLLDTLGVESAPNSEMFNNMLKEQRPMVLASNKNEYEQLVSFVFESVPFMPDFVISELAKTAEKNHSLHSQIFYNIHNISKGKVSFSSPLDVKLREFTKPVLITWGSADRVLHPEGAPILSSVIPKAKFYIIDGIGHLPMIEDPKTTAEHFITFNSRE